MFAEIKPTKIGGFVSKGYEAVRNAFEENFANRGELGGDAGRSKILAGLYEAV